MSEAVKRALATLADGGRPDRAEMRQVFEAILSGEVEPALIAGFLVALRMRGESVADIVAGAEVLRATARRVAAPAGAVDTCGTGGLPWVSLNTSTAAAFVAAGAGAVVAKHGNRSTPPKTGSADVLEALGVNLAASDAQVEASFQKAGVAFLFAPAHHSAMRHVAPVRKALGLRTVFNLLGPLANPAGARRQVLGVFSDAWVEPYANALRDLGAERAWVVHGRDGLDEISTTDETLVAEVREGQVHLFSVTPEAFGVDRGRLDDLRGGAASDNAARLTDVLNGAPGAFTDLVLVNAAATLVVAGLAADIAEAMNKARKSISSGAARRALDALREISHG
jgi:anthranilate phosphoribosyltransferase